MKIAYNKKHLDYILFAALISLLASLPVYVHISGIWTDLFVLFFPTLFISWYFYLKRNTYLTVTKSSIQKNNLFRRKINFDQIKSIEFYAGSLYLRTGKKKLEIDTTIIEAEDLAYLNSRFKGLDVEWL
jgi:hypothetical protein